MQQHLLDIRGAAVQVISAQPSAVLGTVKSSVTGEAVCKQPGVFWIHRSLQCGGRNCDLRGRLDVGLKLRADVLSVVVLHRVSDPKSSAVRTECPQVSPAHVWDCKNEENSLFCVLQATVSSCW